MTIFLIFAAGLSVGFIFGVTIGLETRDIPDERRRGPWGEYDDHA